MRFGFSVPNGGPLATPQGIRALAEKGEALGFDMVAAVDHVVIPNSIESIYPYSPTGKFTPASAGADMCLEIISLLSYLAAATERLALVTSVMVVPYRPAVLTAKMLATIDAMSGGRVVLGIGTGWMEEEFVALEVPPYAERGKVTDEYIAAFRELWTNPQPSFDGEYVKFDNITCEPKPVTAGGVPIWIGGESGPAMRRAGRIGDGWYPIGINPKNPLGTPEQYAGGVAKVRAIAEEAGRDPADVTMSFFSPRYNENEEVKDVDGNRVCFTGSPQQIAGDINAYAEIGCEDFMFGFLAPSIDEAHDRMTHFMEEVKPLVD